MLTVTVSQINRYIKAVLDEDKKLADLYVKGEISNFTHHYKSGHFYLSLKDESSVIRAIMFKSDAELLAFEPENGMQVLVRARVGAYERDGAYQLYITDIQPDGAGAVAIAFEQRKAKLAAKGFFDEQHKKRLPAFPKRIGVITSETGAAFQDVVSILKRRYPLGTVVLAPALMQGDEAPDSVKTALESLQKEGNCDVIIIARGGGSTEDLWSFNDEMLAKAVFDCDIPVISAIGHETDFTICDFVADVRAATPSAAAELAAPNYIVLKRQLSDTLGTARKHIKHNLNVSRYSLKNAANRTSVQKPQYHLRQLQEKLDFFTNTLYNKKSAVIKQKRKLLLDKVQLLDSLSPFSVLSRGYTMVYRDGNFVRSASALQEDDSVVIQFADGKAEAKIFRISGEELT